MQGWRSLLLHSFSMVGFMLFSAGTVFAQTFEYYHASSRYRVVNLPAHSLIVTRFDVPVPFTVEELHVWFVHSASEIGSADVLLVGPDPTEIAPNLENILTTFKAQLDPFTDARYRYPLPSAVAVMASPVFLVVIPRTPGVSVRMDMDENPASMNASPRNSFALFDREKVHYLFGHTFENRTLLGNWYLSLRGTSGPAVAHRFADVAPLKTVQNSNALRFARPLSTSRMAFSIPEACQVSVSVVDSEGRPIRDLGKRYLNAGMHFIEWDERDAAGTSVSPGQYELRVLTDTGFALKRILRLE